MTITVTIPDALAARFKAACPDGLGARVKAGLVDCLAACECTQAKVRAATDALTQVRKDCDQIEVTTTF